MFTTILAVLSQHLALLAASIASLFFIIVLLRLGWLYRRLNRALAIGTVFGTDGKAPKSIEQALAQATNDLAELKKFTTEMRQYLVTVEQRLKNSIQATSVVRYNPFRGTGDGGANSFSAAFLNEHGDGLVVTGLYARDRISVFGKPVANFISERELSEEEQQAIDSCKQKLTTK